MTSEISIIEKAVLEKLLDGTLLPFSQLRRQLELCTVVKRESTGFSFYTMFSVPADIPRTTVLDIRFGDVVADIPELSSGAGFLLYVKDGVIDMLEGYSYDEPWPTSIDCFNLRYIVWREARLGLSQ